jgi:hypothetical protein
MANSTTGCGRHSTVAAGHEAALVVMLELHLLYFNAPADGNVEFCDL